MTVEPPSPASPSWGPTTKLVVGLTFVALVALLLIQFRMVVGPLLLAFILAYLLHPVVIRFAQAAHFPWRTSVNLIYILLIVLLAGIFTLAGLAIVQQIQSLVEIITLFINNLPDLISTLSTQEYHFGPFQLDFTSLNLEAIANQALAAVQPLLGRVGTLVGTLATTTATTLGWTLFILVISYFLLAESGHMPGSIVSVNLPGYNADVRRLALELRLTWNAFLRGQLIIILLVIVSYTLLMGILGMRFVFAIAIMAGLARFVPYVGPVVTWSVTGLVAYFQGSNHFGLPPLQFTILVIVLALVVDQIFDNLVSPRLMGHTLGVHPAAVLVSALVATRWIGLTGLVLAAPALATLQLVGRYMFRKMFDLPPWPDRSQPQPPEAQPWSRSARRLRAWWRVIQRKP